MNVSNPYECLTIYRPGYGFTGYLKGKIAGQWGEDQFQEMLEWESNFEAMTQVLEAMQRQRQGMTAGQAYSENAFAAAYVSRYAQTGNIQDALTVSDPSARTYDVSQTADPNAILPTDSTEVKLEKLQRIAETADYTGMSYGEIYKTILDRYQQAFDGKMLALISGFVGGSDRDSICHQFAREMDDAVYHPLWREIEAETGLRYGQPAFQDYWYEHYRFELGAEALGYGGMNPEEIEKAVAEKYAGKNTLADFAAMMEELHLSGVLDHKLGRDGANSLLSMLGRKLYEVRPEDNYDGGRRLDLLWDRAQREPFNLQSFADELKNAIQNHMSFYNYEFDIRGTLLQSIDTLLAMFE